MPPPPAPRGRVQEKYVALAGKAKLDADSLRNLEQVTEAITVLFRVQSELASHVPMFGHITKLVELLKRPSSEVQVSLPRFVSAGPWPGASPQNFNGRRRRCCSWPTSCATTRHACAPTSPSPSRPPPWPP